LLFLSATLLEVLTGSTKVQSLFSPGFAVLIGLYGGGSLVIREVTVLWKKRWASILLLGGAYAIVEEGFAAKTMVDPAFVPYSRWLGINWMPFTVFSVIEGTFAIAFMILLIELLFPDTRAKRLTGKIGLGIAIFVFAASAVLISRGDAYSPSFPVFLFLAVFGLAETISAYLVPSDLLRSRVEVPDRSESRFLAAGLAFVGGILIASTIGPLVPVVLDVALVGLVAFSPLFYLVRHAGRYGNEPAKIAFGLGMVAAFAPGDLIMEFSGDAGVLVFTAFGLGLLLYLRRRWMRNMSAMSPPCKTEELHRDEVTPEHRQ